VNNLLAIPFPVAPHKYEDLLLILRGAVEGQKGRLEGEIKVLDQEALVVR
jgi:hypothetical protein